MQFRVLTPRVEVIDDDGAFIPITQPLIRAAVCGLLLSEGRPLSPTGLMQLIWREPVTRGAMRICIYGVRKVIGAHRLVWGDGTYRLMLDEHDQSDLHTFREMIRDAERAHGRRQLASAAELLDQALRLWHGGPLQDLPDTPVAIEAADGVTEEVRQAKDTLLAIRIVLGHYRDVIELVSPTVEAEPLNEEAWGRLMLALYKTGRPAEALHAYFRARTALAEADVEPGEHLRKLRRQVQNRDPALGPAVDLMPALSDQDPAPLRLDASIPHSARMYDYWLGGKDNFRVDRELGDKIVAAKPGALEDVRANRAFLKRAVRHVVRAGIRQLIDIGSGLPTVENTHEIAQQTAPDVRVVYVDNDPMAVTHGRALLANPGSGSTSMLYADLRQPDAILGAPQLLRLIDLDQPLAMLLLGVVEFIADDETPAAREIVARLVAAMPRGSYLIVSHLTGDNDPEQNKLAHDMVARERVRALLTYPRTRAQIARFFDGLTILEPGIVPPDRWRPDGSTGPAERFWLWSGVGIKELGAFIADAVESEAVSRQAKSNRRRPLDPKEWAGLHGSPGSCQHRQGMRHSGRRCRTT